LQNVAPAGGAPHVPIVWPEAIVHTPPQQAELFVQASPFWMQKDDAVEQRPDAQSFEQHSSLVVQALPEVLQAGVSALQTPPAHVPLQHSESDAHARASEVHACAEHCPPTHASEQQSRDVAHGASAASQLTVAPATQDPVRGSQRSEQHSASLAQWFPAPAQRLAPPKPFVPVEVVPDAPPHPPHRTAAPTTATNTAKAHLINRNRSIASMPKQGRDPRLRSARSGEFARSTRGHAPNRPVTRPTNCCPQGELGAVMLAVRNAADDFHVVLQHAPAMAVATRVGRLTGASSRAAHCLP
jgi:hypothetical protein